VIKGLVDLLRGLADTLGRKESRESVSNPPGEPREPGPERQGNKWWDARAEAMETVLGEMDSEVLHAVIPFQLGADLGGAADVVTFSQNLDGIAYWFSR
jgi:hypothetical protein